MRATIDFINHKNGIKAYVRRLDPWPRRRPLEMLEIFSKMDLKMHFKIKFKRKIINKKGQKRPRWGR